MAVTHSWTQFTLVFRYPRVKNRKKEFFFRETCFEKVVSHLREKKPMCPQHYFKTKVQKLKIT